MSKFIFTTIISLLTLISAQPEAYAIFGGNEVDRSILNSVVNIKFQNGMCSGSVVSSNVILTAAHCRDRSGEPEFVVIYNPDGPALACDISNVIDYSYSPSAQPTLPMNVHAPDILLLKIETPLCSANIATLSNASLDLGDELFHTGYGAGSGILYETNEISLRLIESMGVERFTTNTDSISRRLLNLGKDFYFFALPTEKNTTACHGDSGGPLYSRKNGVMNVHAVNGAVMGHNEYGASGCNQGYLHMITPIQPYYDWLQSQINEWSL